MTSKDELGLSVVISTWNNANRLRITLGALARCRVPDGCRCELVIVNNNCTDDTDVVVGEYSGPLPLVYVHEARPGLSYGRNAGLATATGRLIVFTDDDVEPCEEWLNIYWRAFQQYPQKCYFGGPITSEFEHGRPDDLLLRFSPPSVRGLDWGIKARVLQRGEYVVSANWACPREAVVAMGAFDVNRGLNPACGRVRVGEETDLMDRLCAAGFTSWYLADARLKHFVPEIKCSIEHVASRIEATYRQTAMDEGMLFGRHVDNIAGRLRLRLSEIKWLLASRLAHLFGVSEIWAHLASARARGALAGLRERRTRRLISASQSLASIAGTIDQNRGEP